MGIEKGEYHLFYPLSLLFREDSIDANNNQSTPEVDEDTVISENVEAFTTCYNKKYKEVMELDTNNKWEEAVLKVRRLGKLSDKPWNPSKLLCTKSTGFVRFRVDRPISVVSYGFFGPFGPGNEGKYHVDMELFTDCYQSVIASTKHITGIVKENEIFHVNFDYPIPILPCTWYIAKFSLMGPETGQGSRIFTHARFKNETTNCQFKFEEPDSNQMPEIGYIFRF